MTRNNSELIGYIVVEEPTVKRFQGYETASWWTDVSLSPGRYEIRRGRPGALAYILYASLPGIVVDEYFVNRLFSHSSVAPKRDVGKPFTYPWQTYDYVLAGIVAQGGTNFSIEGAHIELAEGVEVIRLEDGHYPDGRAYERWEFNK